MTTQELADVELRKWWDERIERERIKRSRELLNDLSRRLNVMRELYIESK